MSLFSENLKRGFFFLRENPQVFYTTILVIIIPVAFLFSSQEFLNVAQTAQVRLERERIGVLQDIFVAFAKDKIADSAFLQEKMEFIAKENKTLTVLKTIRLKDGLPQITASLNKTEIGTVDEFNQQLYATASINPATSFIFDITDGETRGWKAVRGIINQERELIGFFYAEISMAELDALVSKKIRNAYVFLAVILAAVIIMLLQQAKMIDYAKLYQKLQEADKTKDEFLSIAAHELRAPLSAIKGYADDALENTNLNSETKKDLTVIQLSAERLNLLISDILDVSRLAAGKLVFDYQKFDPAPMAKRVTETLQNEAKNKGLILEFSAKAQPYMINADSARLEQALINIVSNAIKYTPKGSIIITVEKQYDSGYIRIADTGLGISAEEQKHLFEKFFRIQSKETREIIGTGLGLWITKSLIEKMGGEIFLESIKNVGAHFIIKFPIKN